MRIETKWSDAPVDLGAIGRTGENAARVIEFDCTDALTEYPDASILCAIRRPCDSIAYLGGLTADGKKRTLTLTAAECAVKGRLHMELRVVDGDTVLKTATYTGWVEEALTGSASKPGNPAADLLNRLDATLDRAENSVSAADQAAKAAQTIADTVQAKLDAGEFKGEKGDPGESGGGSVTAESITTALGYTPANPADFAPDTSPSLTNLFPDNITVLVNQFCKAGNVCMFTYQVNVTSALTVDYGAAIAQLPFASVMRMWLNNGSLFWVDSLNKNVQLNDEKLAAGNYTLSGMYITTD